MNLLHILSAAILCWAVILVNAGRSSDSAWAEHQLKHPIKSKYSAEIQKRRKNFDRTYSRIESHNKDPNRTFEMGHNKFSDMDDRELKQYLSQVPLSPIANDKIRSVVTSMRQSLPEPVDYRNHNCMLPVKDQGNCGSCWAFTATAPIEFRKCLLSGNPPVSLSEQHLVSCDAYDLGCAGGRYVYAWFYLARTGGQVNTSSYPYTSTNGTNDPCIFNNTVGSPPALYAAPPDMVAAQVVVNNASADVNDIYPIGWSFSSNVTSTNVLNMANALASGNLISASIDVVLSFFYYRSGVYYDKNCKVTSVYYLGAHGVTIVGFGTLNGRDYWVVRNSWGSNWGGMGGYFLIQRGINLCRIESFGAMIYVQP